MPSSPASTAIGRVGRWPGWLLVAGLLVVAHLLGLAFLGAGALDELTRSLASPSAIFLGIFLEAAPYLLVGTVVSAAIHVFVGEATIARLAPRQPLAAALVGAVIGAVFPVCECGVVPVCRRLVQKGAPLSLAVTLLLAAPVINPIVLIGTFVAFGGDWQMVAWRAGLTAVIAITIGLLFSVHAQPETLLAPGLGATPGQHDHHEHQPAGLVKRVAALLGHAGAEFVEMSRFLVIGALLAALLQTVVPRPALLALGAEPLPAVLVMMTLAVILSICSTVDAFIALGFAGAFSSGALLAFLVFGPMIDIKSTLMFLTVFRRRAVAVIVLLTFQMTLLATLLISYTSPR